MGKTKKYSDNKVVENIEDLFFEYLRVAEEIKPKVIIGENVAGLLAGEAKLKLNEIVNTFEKIGYDVSKRNATIKVFYSRHNLDILRH